MKLVVYNNEDPDVAITFDYATPAWYGTCTQCGVTLHHGTEQAAFTAGQVHVDTCAEL